MSVQVESCTCTTSGESGMEELRRQQGARLHCVAGQKIAPDSHS